MSHVIALITVLSFLFLKPAISGDTLFSNQTLRDGKTIVSAKETFELGFFSPPNSTNRYLGIWYKKISDRLVVWVANRDNPVTDSSGFLRIADPGVLVLTDQSAKVIWSSSKSTNPETPRTAIATAKLLDSGNFVMMIENPNSDYIQNNDNTDQFQFLWQSFDYPTDTLLPGMKLGVDSSKMTRKLTSWRNPGDPSTGAYSFRVDPNGFPEIILTNGLTTIYRSGPWNGLGFSGVPEMKPNNIFNFTFIADQNETFYTFTLLNESIYSRLVVNGSIGQLQRFTWMETSQSWNLFWYSPKDQCDDYRECGAYGICDTNLSPVCECVDGFEPVDVENWNLRDGSGGCKLERGFGCGEGEFGFKKMSGMKLPETSTSYVNMNMGIEECGEKCGLNCSCVGYALGDVKRNVGCVMWFGGLVDLRHYAEGGQDLFVRVSSSMLGKGGYSSHKKKPIALIVTLIVVPTFFVLLGCVFFIWKKKLKNNHSRRTEERGKRERSQDLIFDKVLSSGPRDHHSHEQNSNEDFELPLIDLSTLAVATNNFYQGNKLGQGGFGSVFKGTLADGKEIAVKRLSKNSGQGGEEFKNEVLLIAKLQHRNLVRLLACCIEGDEKMLVYEYMQNKSLDCVLFNKVNSLLLDWRKRVNIIVGIARGLLYLHQDSRFRIIHRDLKASNVLLDSEMNPKISDFGMARIFGGDETEVNTKRVVGTYGYMSPEYAMDGIFSIKSDVFSFGVLVLEIVSGKKNRGFYQSSSEHNLLGHAWRQWKEGKALELIDPAMTDSCLEYEVLRCIQVGLLCVQERAEDRPTMSTVVLMLSSESVAIAQPKQPGFCLVSTPFETESSSSKQDSCTVNHVTVTMLDAR